MNSREPARSDPIDIIIARTLKAWVGRTPEPRRGRADLLRIAASMRNRTPLRSWAWRFARGLATGISGIPSAMVRESLFEPSLREENTLLNESTPLDLNLMHLSILHAHTPRLGLFSIFL